MPEHHHRGGVADEDQLDPGLVGEQRRGGVVGGDHRDPVAAALHLAELGERELAGAGAEAPGVRGGCSQRYSFQEDVVDQAGRADPGGERERRPVEVGDLDVVGLDSRGGEERACARRVAGRERTRDRERPRRSSE